jgi:hypothetical protein
MSTHKDQLPSGRSTRAEELEAAERDQKVAYLADLKILLAEKVIASLHKGETIVREPAPSYHAQVVEALQSAASEVLARELDAIDQVARKFDLDRKQVLSLYEEVLRLRKFEEAEVLARVWVGLNARRSNWAQDDHDTDKMSGEIRFENEQEVAALTLSLLGTFELDSPNDHLSYIRTAIADVVK